MWRHRVLFLENDLFSNMRNCEFLRGNSCNVSGVYCASEALEMLTNGEQWSALVTAIDLKSDMNGFAVARSARISHPRLPIVFISEAGTCRELARDIPEAVFVAKPFHPRQIVGALNRALPFAVT